MRARNESCSSTDTDRVRLRRPPHVARLLRLRSGATAIMPLPVVAIVIVRCHRLGYYVFTIIYIVSGDNDYVFAL